MVNTFGTGLRTENEISKALRSILSFKPAAMIETLNLKRPIYEATAAYGHFGREEDTFTWENTSLAHKLRDAAGLSGPPPGLVPIVSLEGKRV
jgi:S-adenosylmethionine synthetase